MKFKFRDLPGDSTLITWKGGQAVIHDTEQALQLADADLGATSAAARIYLDLKGA